DFFFILRWRPNPGWWPLPSWSQYFPAILFGAQQITTSLLASARAGLESLVLPRCLGFTSMGLLNRGQALYTTTVGRANTTLIDSIYPLLPLSANDPKLYARHATLFLQAILVVAVPAAFFLGLECRALSRLFYGTKW